MAANPALEGCETCNDPVAGFGSIRYGRALRMDHGGQN
jgi:hypothetical protein